MDGRDEAAHRVDLAVQHRGADVIERLRQRGARAPAIGRRVVFIVVGPCDALDAAADHVDFPADCRERHFVARKRDRRFRRPASLGLGVSRCRQYGERRRKRGEL